MNVYLDQSCVGVVISEQPFVTLLTIPAYRNDRWEALAQVNSMLAIVEVKLTPAGATPHEQAPQKEPR